jgi:hypothetical protein
MAIARFSDEERQMVACVQALLTWDEFLVLRGLFQSIESRDELLAHLHTR